MTTTQPPPPPPRDYDLFLLPPVAAFDKAERTPTGRVCEVTVVQIVSWLGSGREGQAAGGGLCVVPAQVQRADPACVILRFDQRSAVDAANDGAA